MKFDTIFEMKAPSFLKEAKLNEIFIRQIEALGTEHYDEVIASIISVNTNNEINKSGQIQGAGEPFQNEPLLGLYKTHCLDESMQSKLMNMKASQFGLKRSEGLDEFDIEFTKQQKTIISKQFKKLRKERGDINAFIKEYAKATSKELINNYNENKNNQKLTGNWLIFGKSNNKNTFLYLSVSYNHSKEFDAKIYQSLVNMYSEYFITNLKSGK